MFFMHVFNVFFIKVKKTCFFMFFICKVMFLTSMVDPELTLNGHYYAPDYRK